MYVNPTNAAAAAIAHCEIFAASCSVIKQLYDKFLVNAQGVHFIATPSLIAPGQRVGVIVK